MSAPMQWTNSLTQALHRVVSEEEQSAEFLGGGLRHGELAWEISWRYPRSVPVRRFVFLTLQEIDDDSAVLHALGAACHEQSGRWARQPAGSRLLRMIPLEDEQGSEEKSRAFQTRVHELFREAKHQAEALTNEDLAKIASTRLLRSTSHLDDAVAQYLSTED